MVIFDINVLVAAFRQDAPHHKVAHREVHSCFVRLESIGWQPSFGAAVIRVATNPRAFHKPSTLEECVGFLTAFEEDPTAESIGWGSGFWGAFLNVLKDSKVQGGRVSDAFLATIAIQHDATLITLDKGFAAFPGLKWKNLLDQPGAEAS